jgi:tetratricopeptide (TPR) repeat protein
VKSTGTTKTKKTPIPGLVFSGTAIIVLFFNPNLQDPFNAPKLWLLMLLASSLIGYIFFQTNKNNNKVNSKIVILLALFVGLGFISALLSENQLVSFLGENQRKNGFATYASLSILFYVVAKSIKPRDLNKLEKYFTLVAILLVIYGFMQFAGKDIVTWNNPYNSVIGTAGNPNFSSAIFAILCTYFLTTGFLNFKTRNLFYSLAYISLAVLLFINILNTESLQGVLAFVAGIFVFVLAITHKFNKNLSYFVGLIFLGFTTVGILAMLQIGPLQSYLYKETVSIRGYYWRAGVEMLKNYPLTGVGIDNYGSYFNLYKTVDYSLRFGFDLTSSNAHNTFIQHFATGGIFFGLVYMVLQMYIMKAAIKLINSRERTHFKTTLPIFCGWITFQAQSLVSIDNIAISVLGWLLGALIISLNCNSQDDIQFKFTPSNKSNEFKQLAVSNIAAIVVFIFCSLLFRVESSMFYLREVYNPQNIESNQLVLNKGREFFKLPFNNVSYKNQVGVFLATSGHPNEAVELLNKVLEKTPNALETRNVLANIYESSREPRLAIPHRTEIAKLNPWNAKNYLQQGKNYKALKDYINMEKQLKIIESFAKSTEVYTQARNELVRG